jgi:hypothetical protein
MPLGPAIGASPAAASEDALLVSRPLLAKLLGVHPDTISDFTRAGMPVREPGAPGVAGRYDAVECLAWWRIRRPGTLDAEKARHLKAQADQGELTLAERRGQLVDREQVVREGQAVMQAVRARALLLPRQLAQLGLATDEAAVRGLVRDMLTELSSWSPAEVAEVAEAETTEKISG